MSITTRKQLKKVLKPGTWLMIKWDDCISYGLLVEKPEWQKGSVPIKVFYPDQGITNSHATHGQIFGIGKSISIPKTDYNKINCFLF